MAVKPKPSSPGNLQLPLKHKTRHVITNQNMRHVLRASFVICIFCICLFCVLSPIDIKNMLPVTVNKNFTPPLTGSCPDVMSGMTQGSWITRPLTKNESQQIHAFLTVARSHYNVPASMERADKLCGNVGFPGLKSHPALKFRALCDPLGKTPCCYNNHCVARSEKECSCPTCFDMRQRIHAEYATWKPKDTRCQVKNHTTSSSCKLLYGSEIYFIGDSYLRQMHTMAIMHLTNNYENSTFRPNESLRNRKRYRGPYQFLNYGINTIKRVCAGHTLLQHIEVNLPKQARPVFTLIDTLRSRKGSIILLGQGIHGGYNKEDVWEFVLKPIIQVYKRTKQEWPKFVWVSPHAHGLLKIPRFYNQSDENLRLYNEFINTKLRESDVDVLDTFPFTNGVTAYDGAHYGTAINMLKIQIVYNYIEHLYEKGEW